MEREQRLIEAATVHTVAAVCERGYAGLTEGEFFFFVPFVKT